MNIAYRLHTKLTLCFSLVFFADLFFFSQREAGSITGLYLLALTAAVGAANPHGGQMPGGKRLLGLALGQCAVTIYYPAWLSVAMCLLLLTSYTLGVAEWKRHSAVWFLRRHLRYLLSWWWKLPRDLFVAWLIPREWKHGSSIAVQAKFWLLPAVFGAAFLWLFARANPMIEAWFDALRWQSLMPEISFVRLGFWLLIACGCWALLRPRMKHRLKPTRQRRFHVESLFTPGSLTVSLCIFNALFLLQNGMDIVFLWSGETLPAGMGHATYAHRGAYPLIFTALLAALFVLLALAPGSEAERSRPMRVLVYLWIGQNLVLVGSSILRLLGYIEAYSLTGWRIAALLWMGLVACGLALIVWRLYRGKTGEWLIRANILAAFVLLYMASFMNFDRIIAEYNVRHCREVTGVGRMLDQIYLYHLGTGAIPAMQWYETHAIHSPSGVKSVSSNRQGMEWRLEGGLSRWREWTLRDYFLSFSLEKQEPPRMVPLDRQSGWEMEEPPKQGVIR